MPTVLWSWRGKSEQIMHNLVNPYLLSPNLDPQELLYCPDFSWGHLPRGLLHSASTCCEKAGKGNWFSPINPCTDIQPSAPSPKQLHNSLPYPPWVLPFFPFNYYLNTFKKQHSNQNITELYMVLFIHYWYWKQPLYKNFIQIKKNSLARQSLLSVYTHKHRYTHTKYFTSF